MEEIVNVAGNISTNFVGGISYDFFLEEDYKFIEIQLKFEHVEPDFKKNQMQVLSEKIDWAWEKQSNNKLSEARKEKLIQNQKNEINLLVYLNKDFIGTSHGPETTKEVLISESESSLGFKKGPIKSGILTLVLESYSIISDETKYTLLVKGG